MAVVQRATWPNQLIVRGTLDDIADKIKQAKIKSTAIIIVGRVLTSTDFADSKLYSPEFSHGFRS
ncbi:precorrin-4 methylase [Candidatus Scalindua japonica]|uniref:Precorrin-4 methylase n=1 Tax=Candidatus Scalindua japonica TaxID=1284222 RepID=A0A286U0G5_9BACT|nr:precorrin-4 methylase [Candidatus Scalindua japonica]